MEPNNLLTPEEKLKAENEILKLKLELEYGMQHSDSQSLSLELENDWLQNVYNFERQFKNRKTIKVYDAIGQPPFKKLSELSDGEVSAALEGILSVMSEKAVALDCCCAYDEAVIYKFITEELFNYEMDDMSVAGMTTCFIYEEFHPNHDYDLRRYADEFLENLLTRKWNPEFDRSLLSDKVMYKGNEYNNDEIANIILSIQEDSTFQFGKFVIEEASFDLEKGIGKVSGHLEYSAFSHHGSQIHKGEAVINFKYDFGFWYIQGFQLPEFGD